MDHDGVRVTTARFMTESGTRVPSVTADEMRAVDRIAIDETGPNLFQMMENAGRSLALAAIDLLGDRWRDVPVVVLAGTGGNGGGGICAARHLANRGTEVSVVLTDERKLAEVPAAQLDVYRGTDGLLGTLDDVEGLEVGLIVDAVIGYSLSGVPRGPALDLIEWANGSPASILALDVPSGLDSSKGVAPGAYINADRTLTLALPKTGLDVRAVGEVWLADIGITAEVYRRANIDVPVGLFGGSYIVRLIPELDESDPAGEDSAE